jgi:hypothetical protein
MSKIIEIIEFGFPKSLIKREDEPVSESIDTELLRLELNSIIEEPKHEVILCKKCGVGDTNNDWGCTNPKCEMYPFK